MKVIQAPLNLLFQWYLRLIREFKFLTLTFIVGVFCCSNLFGQVINDDLLHYEMFASQVCFNEDCEDGTDDPTVTFAVRDDTNGQGDEFMGPFVDGQPKLFDFARNWEEDAPTCDDVLGSGSQIDFSEFTTATHYDWHIQSWEDDHDPVLVWNDGDDCRGGTWGRRAIKTGDYPQVNHNTVSLAVNQSKIDYYKIWRYANGDDGATALDFGTLPTNGNSLSHVNGYDYTADYWRTNMIYNDEYNDNGRRDIFYKFTVDNPNNFIITQGNADLRMYLLDDQQNLIDDGTTIITDLFQSSKSLCSGTYYLVVEAAPSAGSKESFTLEIETTGFNVNAGTIEQPSETFCEGAPINITIGSINIGNSVSPNDLESYQWQRKENDGSWIDIQDATSVSLPANKAGLMPNTAEGEDFVQFRRWFTVCDDKRKTSNVVTIESEPSTVSPGQISLLVSCTGSDVVDPLTIPVGVSPGCFQSLNDTAHGSGSPSPISYRWEVSKNMGSSWIDQGENSNSWTAPASVFNTVGEYLIRRIAVNGCGSTAPSDTLIVNAILADGAISGRVTSAPGIGGPGTPVQDVTITVMRVSTTEGGTLTTDTYTAMTNSSGDYVVTDIYYGPGNGADFKVIPSKVENGITHEFDPPELSGVNAINLKNTFKNRVNINFIDETTFSFSGQVFQDFQGSICGMADVVITLNGVVVDTTDLSGKYAIAIPSAGVYTIEANYAGHSFTQYNNFYVDQNHFDKNFESTKTHTLSGMLTDGCNNFIGEAKITIQDSLNCIVNEVTTVGGNFSVNLPARPYKLFFSDHPDVKVNAFFGLARYADLSSSDQMIKYIYRAAPVIDVIGLPVASECPAPYDLPLLEQGEFYPVDIFVYEGTIGGCPLDTGVVLITDQISDRDDEIIRLPISNGRVSYDLLPGLPNLIANHIKTLTIVAEDTLGQQSEPLQEDVIVLGARPREQTFTTVTPELPMMILRDPPGDNSYSFLEKSESFQTSMRMYGLASGSVNVWAELKLGTKFETGGPFFQVETEIYGQIGGSVEVAGTFQTSNEQLLTVTTQELFSTSGNPSVTGTDGDVFIGGAMNLLYAAADVLEFDEDNCNIITDVDLVVVPDGFATEYIYTEQYIRETVISQLEFLANNSPDPDSTDYFLDQIDVWEQALERNEELKKNAVFVENVSFSNNAPYDNSITSETTAGMTYEFNTSITTEVAVEAGLELAGSGVAGGVKVQLKLETGGSTSTTNVETTTTGFHLEDDDIGDGFSVDIKRDLHYNTPVFELVAGVSSCPYEDGTQPRDDPQIRALNPIASNIPISEEAEFTLELSNTSQSGEARTYFLSFDQASNPDGASVEVGGSPYINPIAYFIPANGKIQVTVKVGMGASNVFSYEGLRFFLSDECSAGALDDNTIFGSTRISVLFQSPCSAVSIFEPGDGWLANATNTMLAIHLKDYDKTALDEIQIQISKENVNVWQNLIVVTPSQLNDNDPQGTNLGTIINANLSQMSDGNYNIRAKLVCGLNSVFSMRTSGKKDTRPPAILGIPLPIDDIYDPTSNDEIIVSFDEAISCNDVVIELTRLDDNHKAQEVTIGCINNVAQFFPTSGLPVGGAYRASIINIKDVYGNMAPPVSWIFVTPGFELQGACGPIVINNNNFDGSYLNLGEYFGTTITTDGQVQRGSDVQFRAVEEVQFDVGFQVNTGGLIEANIEPCPDE